MPGGNRVRRGRLGARRAAGLVILAALPWLSARAPALAQSAYALDQRFGAIDFSVSDLGLFTTSGRFQKFDAALAIDVDHPERTSIDVRVDAGSVDMPWQGGVAMLRSAEFFDVEHYPTVHFKSSDIEVVGPGHYMIRGSLMIRGVTQPLVLDARLISRHLNAQGATDIAEFIVSGVVKRSAFGMTADRNFISDDVKLKISAELQLAAASHAD